MERHFPKPSIRLTSSCFLLPGSQAWRPLAALGALDFGSYGDWPNALLTDDRRTLILLLFLQDVVPPEHVDRLDNASLDEALAPLIVPLTVRLQRVQAPTIVAWSTWNPDSPIAEARTPSPWRRLGRHLADRLYELAARHPPLYLIALDDVFAKQGLRNAFDARNFYAARCRLSRQGLASAAEAAAAILDRLSQSAKKVLVLDCDDTLWGGVVGEVGLSGLTLGSDGLGHAYSEFQRAALRCSRQGVLLALASKNNEAEVWEVFDSHPGMVLQRADIVSARIDWNGKAANVTAMAEELGLGLDSFVFWDDNPLERDKMRAIAPEVTTIEVPDDVTEWPALLSALDLFARFSVTSEDLHKVEQYRSRAAFTSERNMVRDERQFLYTIGMRATALPLSAQTLARAEQMCAKTNQFNLRTIRRSAADLSALAEVCGDCAFVVQFSDRFGDHGIVGLAIARTEGAVAVLDSFLLSCRVLGRRLEGWMLHQLATAARQQGCRWLVAQYIPSGRNTVAADFLAGHGLERVATANLPPDEDLTAAIAAHGDQGVVHVADLETLDFPDRELFAC